MLAKAQGEVQDGTSAPATPSPALAASSCTLLRCVEAILSGWQGETQGEGATGKGARGKLHLVKALQLDSRVVAAG
jgi:hypothetical protein